MKISVYKPGTKITESGIYSGVPMRVYHSGQLCDGPSISSSGLRTIFSESEMHYWVHSPYNPLRIEQPDTDDLSLGRAAHHLFCGEGTLETEFIPQPEKAPDGTDWQPNKKGCREWVATAKEQGYSILKPKDVQAMRGMAGFEPWQKNLQDSGLVNCHFVRDQGLLNGLVEHTIVWKRKDGVFLLARPDVIPTDSLIGADIKTTTSVSDEALDATYSSFRYDMQAAVARMALRGAADVELAHFAFVFVSKKEPFAVRCKVSKDEEIDQAEKDCEAAIRAFSNGMKTGQWPGPGGTTTDMSYVGLRPWAATQAGFRRQELLKEHT